MFVIRGRLHSHFKHFPLTLQALDRLPPHPPSTRSPPSTMSQPQPQPQPSHSCSTASSPIPVSAPPPTSSTSPTSSRSQMKKRKRLEKMMEKKRRRKEQDKAVKLARAVAEGRDLDEERRVQEANAASGAGHARREQKWLRRIEEAKNRFKVCVDCSYEDQMTQKEIGSLSTQIRYCYAINKRSPNPVFLSVPSLSGETYEKLAKVEGFPERWKARAFSWSDKSLVEMHAAERAKLVMLTSDAENTLEHLDDGKIYVIGGIVDRNRLKFATKDRAEELGIETACLPISDHLKLFSTRVLTCNHVFDILLKYRQHGNDWKKAMLDVLPKRKDAQEGNEGGGGGGASGKRQGNVVTSWMGTARQETS